MKKFLSILLSVVILTGMTACSSDQKENGSSSETRPEMGDKSNEGTPSGPEYAEKMQAMLEGTGEYADNPIVTMETSEGTVKIRLFPQDAPLACENFIGLIKEGYYDGLTFHRVIKDFMIQGGDPTGTGAGGDSIWNKDFDIEYSYYMWHLRGCLAMANTGMPTSNGSQFYIVQGNYYPQIKDQMAAAGFPQEVVDLYDRYGGRPDLDLLNPQQGRYGYTKFGYVVQGMDIVDKIAALDNGEADANGNPQGKTSTPVTITKMTVEEKAQK